MMPHFAWLGLWLSLNQNALPARLVLDPHPAVEATALVGAGRFTITTVVVRPLRPHEPALISVGVGLKVF